MRFVLPVLRMFSFAFITLVIFTPFAAAQKDAPKLESPKQVDVSQYQGTIRVACVGDSITAGVGVKNGKTEAYPVQLDNMLGEKWTVKNFGVSGSTMLNKGDKPYQKEKAFKAARIHAGRCRYHARHERFQAAELEIQGRVRRRC